MRGSPLPAEHHADLFRAEHISAGQAWDEDLTAYLTRVGYRPAR